MFFGHSSPARQTCWWRTSIILPTLSAPRWVCRVLSEAYGTASRLATCSSWPGVPQAGIGTIVAASSASLEVICSPTRTEAPAATCGPSTFKPARRVGVSPLPATSRPCLAAHRERRLGRLQRSTPLAWCVHPETACVLVCGVLNQSVLSQNARCTWVDDDRKTSGDESGCFKPVIFNASVLHLSRVCFSTPQ